MVTWNSVALFAILLGAVEPASRPAATASAPAASQPTSRPALRRPAQAEVLRNLLSQADRPQPVAPVDPGKGAAGKDAANPQALVEGTLLVERPGRLIREDGRAKFLFSDGKNAATKAMPILESQLLEVMERESESGFPEFIVSAEVTRYKGSNYLLLRKVLRRTGNGNLTP